MSHGDSALAVAAAVAAAAVAAVGLVVGLVVARFEAQRVARSSTTETRSATHPQLAHLGLGLRLGSVQVAVTVHGYG